MEGRGETSGQLAESGLLTRTERQNGNMVVALVSRLKQPLLSIVEMGIEESCICHTRITDAYAK